MSGGASTRPKSGPRPPNDRIHDPARLAALRALCLEDGRTNISFDRLTRLAANFLHAPVALVNIIEHDRQVTRSAFGPETYQRGDEAPLANSICQLGVQSGEPVVIGNARNDARVSDMACVATGIAAYAGVPLTLSSGEALGSLCVVDFSPREWTAAEISVLTDLACAVTTELELCAAHRAAEARSELVANARRLEAVESITDVALTQATLDDTLRGILARLRELLSSDTATVLLLSEDGRELRVRDSLGLEEEVTARTTIPIGKGIAGRIAASRVPVIIPDVATADTVSPALRATIRSLVGAPLLLDDVLLGVVHVGSTTRRSYDEDDLRLLTLAAARISAAIERARLFDAERAARVAAEAASGAKSAFLAVMSHELRTPLNAIGGYAQLLEAEVHGPLTPGQLGAVERIRAGQVRLTQGIDDILRWVDLERASAADAPRPIALSPVVEKIRARLTAAATAARLEVDFMPCAADMRAMGNEALVTDILTRLFDNAVKFTPAGGRLSVHCEPDGDRSTVVISDTGIGIAEDRLTNVFEPFVQGDPSYRRAHEGLGLGLAIARAEAQRMGGDVVATRKPAGGTVVTLLLRRAE